MTQELTIKVSEQRLDAIKKYLTLEYDGDKYIVNMIESMEVING